MAQKIAIVTDSSACLPAGLAARYAIQVVPLSLIFGEVHYRDGVDISPAEFYTRLRETREIPRTAHSSPGAYLAAYRKAAQIAPEVLCITLSSSFSGQFNSAQVAAELAREAMPELTVRVLDSGTAASAQGFVVLVAAQAASGGDNPVEVLTVARRVARRVYLVAMVDSLDYLVRGGHVPRAAAWANSLFRIKPLVALNGGEARPVARTRSKARAMERIIGIIRQRAAPRQPLHIAVMHADALDDAVTLRDKITARYDCAELYITEFTPVMGAHIGPGLVGVAFYPAAS